MILLKVTLNLSNIYHLFSIFTMTYIEVHVLSLENTICLFCLSWIIIQFSKHSLFFQWLLRFCVCFVDRCLSFFLWPLCCLSFLDSRIQITPLISSNFFFIVVRKVREATLLSVKYRNNDVYILSMIT